MPYALIAAVVLAAFAAGLGYLRGSASRNPEIAELQAAIATSAELARQAESRAKATGARVVTVYKDRVKVITESAPAQIEIVEVIKREVDPNCLLPPSIRLLHDSAASGSALPSPAARANAAPVAPSALAATVAANYRTARENAERLAALQSYISQIAEVPGGSNH